MITLSLQDTLMDLAKMWAPEEACGLLIGVGKEYNRILCLVNHSSDPKNSFELSSSELVSACAKYGRENMAFWHTHPKGRPWPSPEDVELMKMLDGMPMVIVGLEPTVQVHVYGVEGHRIVVKEKW